MRASRLDSDADGLPRPLGVSRYRYGWRRQGRRYSCQKYGAQPNVRDIFIEVDRLPDRDEWEDDNHLNPHHSNVLLEDTVEDLEEFFSEAPALTGTQYGVTSDGSGTPDPIPEGITLHLDQGRCAD